LTTRDPANTKFMMPTITITITITTTTQGRRLGSTDEGKR
jgi:hypothetical protein